MSDSEEYTTPKIDGEGDGIKNITTRKRLPVPSCRKFNARVSKDESLRLRLEKALDEMQGKTKYPYHDCLKKAKTVAEITPTKTKAKKRPHRLPTHSELADSKETTLHATPRGALMAPQRCTRPAAVCTVTRRMMVLAWRRNKTRLSAATESCGRLQGQISQLELQVDVLKNLRNSESDKRREASNECIILKGQIERLVSDKTELKEELTKVKSDLKQVSTNLDYAKCDLKKCAEHVGKLQEQLKKKREEKIDLDVKLSSQERQILAQDILISHLRESLKTAEMNVQNTESNLNAKKEEINELYQQLQAEVEVNCSMREELSNLKGEKNEIEKRSRLLEDQLGSYINSCEELQAQNESILNDLGEVTWELDEEKKKWYNKNTRELALLSLSALQKFANVLLPVFLDSTL